MRHGLALIALLLFAGCTGSPPAPASTEGADCLPSNPNVSTFVYGVVADASGTALAEATVVGKMLAHEHQVTAAADARGCYWLDIGVGEPHDLVASKAGYKAATEKSVALNAGEHRRVNFHLGT